MITRLVLFRLKPGISPDDARVLRLQTEMAALPGRIASIRRWEFGANTTADPEAWEFGLRAGFDTHDALLAYFDDHVITRRLNDGRALLKPPFPPTI